MHSEPRHNEALQLSRRGALPSSRGLLPLLASSKATEAAAEHQGVRPTFRAALDDSRGRHPILAPECPDGIR